MKAEDMRIGMLVCGNFQAETPLKGYPQGIGEIVEFVSFGNYGRAKVLAGTATVERVASNGEWQRDWDYVTFWIPASELEVFADV